MDLRLLIPFTEESASILVTRHTNSFQKYERQNAPERMCLYGRGCGDSEEARWGGWGTIHLMRTLVICMKKAEKN